MDSAGQEATSSAVMTAEQRNTFKDWMTRHHWRSRPSLQTARDVLELNYSKHFPDDELTGIIDEVFGENSAPEPSVLSESAEQNQDDDDDNNNNHNNGKPLLPGYGRPLDFIPPNGEHFPVLVGRRDEGWAAATLTIRELCMLRVVEDLTNKPEWWDKVRDPEISQKWKTEILAVDWPAYHKYADFTPKMATACIEELARKADLYEGSGLIPVLDYSACVIKSDCLFDSGLRLELIQAVGKLEDVPDAEKDWHPGSDGKVLDLVHPSLYPLTYGRSRILAEARIDVENCLDHVGVGEIIPKPNSDESISSVGWGRVPVSAISLNYQWLPSDINITKNGEAKISSYINNLHPVKHKALYPIIEQFISKSLPAWDLIYRWPKHLRFQRLVAKEAGVECTTPAVCGNSYECQPSNRPLNNDEPLRAEDEGCQDNYDDSARGQSDLRWFLATHHPILPDATTNSDVERNGGKRESVFSVTSDTFKKNTFFEASDRIQVIVKLANIHLTPDNPTSDGGSWHLEGQRNEHICATALYYYDNENITESRLAFRTCADAEELSASLNYAQDDIRSIARTFAIDSRHEATTLQNVGSVLTQEGRAIFFPNLFQHQIQPFSLADRTQPGHRKILALFLVDPAIPIISTANVAPQQRHWWLGEDYMRLGNRLPLEISQMALRDIDFSMSEEEARDIREKLMSERTVLQDNESRSLQRIDFSFCEH